MNLTFDDMALVADWAAQECEWQMSGEKSVADMIRAYIVTYKAVAYVEDPRDLLSNSLVMRLGHLVEPTKNYGEYRYVNVRVGINVMPSFDDVPRLMEQLLFHGEHLSPTEWFKEFEEIHPFVDGNGRVGAILFNMLSGTLDPVNLQFPPNLFDDPRR